MRRILLVATVCCLGVGQVGWAKDKAKRTLPPYVLTAHTVAVVVDPEAGVSVEDPRANQVAQKDVETALMTWGRFEPVIGSAGADLIVVIRRGHGRIAEETVGDPRQNSRAGVVNPTEDGVGIGVQHGTQPPMSGSSPAGPRMGAPEPRAEIGREDDEFTVFQGGVDRPLDGAPAWRWIRKDALHPHDVPAVGEFRNAVAEAEKAAAAKKP